MLEADFENAVALDLRNTCDPRAAQVLAQQHAQIERLQRAALFQLRQVRPRAARAGREQQHVVRAAIAYGQYYFVALGLNDAVDASAR